MQFWCKASLTLCLILGCGTLKESPSSASTSTGAAMPAQSATPAKPPTAQSPSQPSSSVTPLSSDFRTQDERNSIEVFRLAAPSTVFVTQKRVVVDYFRRRAAEVPSGSGSGFIWDDKGHVVTNFHVIRKAQSLSVTLHDHQVFEATVRGVEPRKDIAVLKIDDPPDDLVPIQVRSKAGNLQVGQKTIAIGNPFGLDQTLTTGIVSALGREVQGIGGVTIRDMVQTDAAINPGNSGGPLLDSTGHLIGMNTMIFSRSGGSAGIGFAVPVNAIKRVVPQIVATGRAEQVGLGVQIDPAQRLERRLGIQGVVVLRVLPDTPAAKAGLKGISQSTRGISLGDIIIAINEHKIQDYDDLYNTLDRFKPGQRVTVTVLRNRERIQVQLQLVRLP